MLNPLHLRTLATVVETGSFADAARELGYTASAVSQQVSTLERQLKVKLFERLPRSVRPTFAAEYLAERSGTALAALGTLEEEVLSILGGEAGRLRLGSFPSASERLLPHALSVFKRRHPGVHIRLDEGEPDDVIALLSTGELDVGVVYRYSNVPPAWQSLPTVRLLREDILVLLPTGHPAADATEVGLASLVDDTWIATREGTAAVTMLRHLCHGAGFEPRISYRSNNYAVIQGLVQAGLGVAIVPALPRYDLAGVTAVRIEGHDVSREVHLAVATHTTPALTSSMGIALREAAAESARHLGIYAGERRASDVESREG